MLGLKLFWSSPTLIGNSRVASRIRIFGTPRNPGLMLMARMSLYLDDDLGPQDFKAYVDNAGALRGGFGGKERLEGVGDCTIQS